MPLCFTPFNPHAKFYFIGKLRSNLCRPQTKAILWYTHSWRLKTQIDSTSLSFKISRDAGHGPLLTHAHLVHNGEKCPKRSNHKKDLGKNWYTHSWRLKTQIDSTSLSFKISRDAGHGPLLTHAHLVHNGEKCPKRSNHKKDLGKNPHWSGAKARFSIHHPFFPKAPHFP
jgi:hypothetical protein